MNGQRDRYRLAMLAQHTRRAIAQLRDLRCVDPAAADARDAVRLTVHTLESWWLPTLTELSEARPAGDRR